MQQCVTLNVGKVIIREDETLIIITSSVMKHHISDAVATHRFYQGTVHHHCTPVANTK